MILLFKMQAKFLNIKFKYTKRTCMRLYLTIIIIIYSVFIPACSQCTRERCCLVTTCTQSYCTQRNSETWISTQNFNNYGFTQLVMSNNQCLPCPYNCQSCSSPSTCQTCAQGFYMSNNECLICSYKCNSCVVVNSITKCSSCSTGTYLESLTSSCKNCATGAAECSTATVITKCNSGYMLTSNSLFCLPCPSNCLTCPTSNTLCSSCSSGYYLKSSACLLCTLSNCINCFLLSNNQRCSSCSTGYYLSSGACVKCQTGCSSCSSSACLGCSQGYYLVSGGCNLATNAVSNCNVYSSPSTCSTCVSTYFLSAGKCFSCSLLCTSCYGIHFGVCTVCSSSATLFNQMCLANKYNSNNEYQVYYSYPSSLSLLSGGAEDCNNYLYKSTSISISLNNLSASRLRIRWRLFSISGSSTYAVAITNTAGTQTLAFSTESSQLKSYSLCDQNSSTLYYGGIGTNNFTSIRVANTLTFSTNNGLSLGFQQLLVIVQTCNALCIQCSTIACTRCLMTNLYTQDAYCVYTCSSGYYIHLNSSNAFNPKSCVQNCPIGTYSFSTNLSCVTCKSPCLSCTNDNFCLSCVVGYFLTAQNTCSQICPYRYFGQSLTKSCKNCVGRCRQCLDQERCLNCKTGFFYSTNFTCLDSCSASLGLVGLYANLTTLKCQSCDSLCKNCNMKSDYCTECNTGYYFYNFTCLNSCPVGYYSNNFICELCSYPCQNCAADPLRCSSCVDRYLMNESCLASCPKGYFQSNQGLICQACKTGCQECAQHANHCTQCSINYYLYNQDCLSVCPNTFYKQDLLKLCLSCSGLCHNCLNETFCTSCTTNFLWQGQCLDNTQCPIAYYANSKTLACQLCSTSCKTCQFSIDRCSSCHSNSSTPFLQENKCVSLCSSTQRFPTVLNNISICTSCLSPCIKCVNETYCIQCISGYNLMGGNCGTNCIAGYFFNSSAATCVSCFQNCLICNTLSFCQLCQSQYFIYILNSTANQCRSTCPTAYYPNNLEGSCQPCLYPCLQCSSRIDCISCQQGSLYLNRCLSYCPDTTYVNQTLKKCLPCSSACLTCLNLDTNCLTCKTGLILYQVNSSCLQVCPSGSYGQTVTQMCLQCSNLCRQCINSTFCTSCIQNRTYLYSLTNMCINDCPIGFYGDKLSATCITCNAKCLTCKNSPENCLSCSQNYYLIRLTFSTFDCLSACPSMHYVQSQNCQKCIFPCNTCSSASSCLTCVVGTYYYAQLSACLLSCPAASYINYQTSSCIICKAPCSSCKSDTYCLSCLNNQYLHNGGCLSKCPSSYYSDNTLICQTCSGLCKTCSSKFYCLSCITGYMSNGFCYNSCPSGTYVNLNTSQCLPCNMPCVQCLFTANYCTTCASGLVQYQGNCSNNCPLGTYLFSGACLQCNFPCINCSSLDICYQCLGGYLLYNGLTCINDTLFCPNDFYKMDGKYCIPRSSCPPSYYIDQTSKTCSSACSPQKYVMKQTKSCEMQCHSYQYVGVNMFCKNYTEPPISLMHMSAITFIRSSILTIDISFNESFIWLNSNKTIYKLTSTSRRLLLTSINGNSFDYIVNQNNPTSILLKVADLPDEIALNLPAHYIVSQSTGYPLQNSNIKLSFPNYVNYDYASIYNGYTSRQFGQGLSWFIILLSLFFLFKNRISHLYGLWDTAQLLFVILFLEIQYPPNLNEFLTGLNTIFLNTLPSIFSTPSSRTISDRSFYAYSVDNNFIRNAGPCLTIFLVVVIIYFILKIFEYLIKNVEKVSACMNNWPTLKKFIYEMLLRYRWHYASDLMFLTYLNVFLFAVAELYSMQKNPNRAFSNVLCVASLVFYLIFPIFVSTKLHKHFPNISKGRHHQNIRCFYRGIDKTSRFGVFLIIIKYFRKIVYALAIGVFSSKPMYALPILMFTSIMMALFTFINMPYKKRLTNIVEIISEICLSLVFLGIAVINFNNQLNNADLNIAIGYVCTGLLIFILLLLVFQIFCRSLFQLQSQENYRKKQQTEKLMDLKDLSQSQIRKKAGQFFDFMFPKIREEFGFGQDSQDEKNNVYEQGDSQNSENNAQREKNWGFEQSQKHSEQFRHYENQSQSDKATGPKQKVPEFLIRCVKQIN